MKHNARILIPVAIGIATLAVLLWPGAGASHHAEDDKLVAWYRLDEATGSTVFDSSNTQNDGTETAATFGAGQVNGAYTFDGATSFVQAPDNAATDGFATGSISFWFQGHTKPASGLHVMVSKGNAYLFFQSSLDKLDLEWGTTGGTCDPAIDSADWTVDTWMMIHGTYDGANCKAYINGVLKSTVALTGTVQATTNLFCLGAQESGGACNGLRFFNGKLDDVKVYSGVALSQAEITDQYQADTHSGGTTSTVTSTSTVTTTVTSTPSTTVTSTVTTTQTSTTTSTSHTTATDTTTSTITAGSTVTSTSVVSKQVVPSPGAGATLLAVLSAATVAILVARRRGKRKP